MQIIRRMMLAALAAGTLTHVRALAAEGPGGTYSPALNAAVQMLSTEYAAQQAAIALLAPKASPVFTGAPLAPTASPLTNNGQVSTTGYADAAVAVEKARALAAEAALAPLASPAFTGAPTAPTPSTSGGVANKGYVDGQIGVLSSVYATPAQVGSQITSALTPYPTQSSVTSQLHAYTSGAGNDESAGMVTWTGGTGTLASVLNSISSSGGAVASVVGQTGAITAAQIYNAEVGTTSGHLADAGTVASNLTAALAPYATTLSPTFTGAPLTPTPTGSTGIANKGYVDGQISGLSTLYETQAAFTSGLAGYIAGSSNNFGGAQATVGGTTQTISTWLTAASLEAQIGGFYDTPTQVASALATYTGTATNNFSGATVYPTNGGGNAMSLADAVTQGVIDIRDAPSSSPYHGDAQTAHCRVTITSGNQIQIGACQGTTPSFSGTGSDPDPGKYISIDQGAAVPTVGPIAALAVTNGGTYPQNGTFPTVSLTPGTTGSGSGFQGVVYMATNSITQKTAGSGCPIGTFTWQSGGGGYVPSFLTASTAAAGSNPASGSLTSTNGTVLTAVPNPSSSGSNTIVGTISGTTLSVPGSQVTASISGTTMTVTAITGSALSAGEIVTGPLGSGVLANTLIQSQLTGTTGGTGTYQVTRSQTVASNTGIGVLGANTGTISNAFILTGSGVSANTYVQAQLTSLSGSGGPGTYQLSVSSTVGTIEQMTVGLPGYFKGNPPSAAMAFPIQPFGAAPCAVPPTVQYTFTVAQVLVPYPGKNYPTSTTYGFVGGSPTVAPTAGAVTETLQAPPLSTTIASVQGPQLITLASPLVNVLSGTQQVDLSWYGDDAPAYNWAIGVQANRTGVGAGSPIYIPGNRNTAFVTATNRAQKTGGVFGLGQSNLTTVLVDPSFPTGNVFDCDNASTLRSPNSSATSGWWGNNMGNISNIATRCVMHDLSVQLWKDSPNVQTAYAVSGISQFSRLYNLDAQNGTGDCLKLGAADTGDTQSAWEEAMVDHVRCRLMGGQTDVDSPAIEITASGTSASSNTSFINDVTAFGPGAQCLTAHDEGNGSGQSLEIIRDLRCESTTNSFGVQAPADLIVIGSPDGITPESNAGSESRFLLDGVFTVSNAAGFAAIKVMGPTSGAGFSTLLHNIVADHIINSGASFGPEVDVEDCANCYFDISGGAPSKVAAAVVVGPERNTGNQGQIQEVSFQTDRNVIGSAANTLSVVPIWTSVDPSSCGAVRFNGVYGDPANPACGLNQVNGQFIAWGGVIAPNCLGLLSADGTNTDSETCITALPSGITATTQAVGDNSADVATDAFVLANTFNGTATQYLNITGTSGQTRGLQLQTGGLNRGALALDGVAEGAPIPLTCSSCTGTSSTVLPLDGIDNGVVPGDTAGTAIGGGILSADIVTAVTTSTITLTTAVSVPANQVVTFYPDLGSDLILQEYDDGGRIMGLSSPWMKCTRNPIQCQLASIVNTPISGSTGSFTGLTVTAGTTTQSLTVSGGSNFVGPVVVPAPSTASQAANKNYVDVAVNTALPLLGGTMTGALHMGSNTIDGSAIAFTGGLLANITLDSGCIGCTTPAAGHFTSLSAVSAFSAPAGSTAPTQTCGDNSTKLATTAYVASCATGGSGTVPRDYIAACTLSNDGTTPASKMDLGACQATDSTNALVISTTGGIVINLAVNGANGLDTGTVSSSGTVTTYHFFIINGTSGTAGLASLSATAPTMPSGYTYFRRVGSDTQVSSTLGVFTQRANHFTWNTATPTQDIAAAALTTTASTIALNIPTGVKMLPNTNCGLTGTTSPTLIDDPDGPNYAPSLNSASPQLLLNSTATTVNLRALGIYSNTSGQIRARSNSTSTLSCTTLGWDDDRGTNN